MNIFGKKFFNPNRVAFGLDLSDISLKIAQLTRNGRNMSLANYGRQDIPDAVIEEGEIKKTDELIQVVKQGIAGVKGTPINTKNCVVSLPETESFISVIQMPKMDRRELKEAIGWEMENHIPLSIDEVYFDWQIVSSAKTPRDKEDILVGALRKTLVDPYLDMLKSAGLRPIVFEIESLATARALIKDEFAAEPTLIIDFGARRTSFIIFFENTVSFTASSQISNEYLINEMKSLLNVDYEEAKRLKFNIGLEGKKGNERVYNALLPTIKELTKEIRKYTDFYRTHGLSSPDDGHVKKIILCGGGANLSGLPTFLSRQLQIPVEIGNPWINIINSRPEKIPELPYEQSVGYATALGLALRGARENDY